MAAKTAARPRRSSPSRRRWLFIGPLAGLALAGLALFLYDYLNAGPAGPVRIVASIMFVTGTALTVLVLLGEERSAKAAVVAAGLIPVIVVLVQLPGPTTRPTHPVIRTPAQTACGPGQQHVRQPNRERDYCETGRSRTAAVVPDSDPALLPGPADRGYRLKPRARSWSRPSSVILSGPHGGIQTQLML